MRQAPGTGMLERNTWDRDPGINVPGQGDPGTGEDDVPG